MPVFNPYIYAVFIPLTYVHRQGHSQKFAKEEQNRGSGGRKPAAWSRGRAPGGGLGEKTPEAGDIY